MPNKIKKKKAKLNISTQGLLDEIKCLTEERDEARRIVCDFLVAYEEEMFNKGFSKSIRGLFKVESKDLAKVYEWNCLNKSSK